MKKIPYTSAAVSRSKPNAAVLASKKHDEWFAPEEPHLSLDEVEGDPQIDYGSPLLQLYRHVMDMLRTAPVKREP